MRFELTRDPREFVSRAGSFLEQRIEDNVLATVTLDVLGGRHMPQPPLFGLGFGPGGQVHWMGVRIPPLPMLAAELDGAGPLGRFLHVTLPMISPAVLFNVVLGLIGTFQFFTQPFVLEGGQNGAAFGGPLQSALFYSPYLWENAFSSFKMGYASALAWILFAVILLCTLAVLRLSRSRVYYEEVA